MKPMSGVLLFRWIGTLADLRQQRTPAPVDSGGDPGATVLAAPFDWVSGTSPCVHS